MNSEQNIRKASNFLAGLTAWLGTYSLISPYYCQQNSEVGQTEPAQNCKDFVTPTTPIESIALAAAIALSGVTFWRNQRR